MEQHIVETFYGNIYIGLQRGYSGDYVDETFASQKIYNIVNEISICCTVTKTEFMYVNGHEPGYIIGFINYPRFPEEKEKLKETVIHIAEMLKESFEQNRVTIVFPNETIMLGSMS